MNLLSLLPVLLSVLGRGKPNIEIPIKSIIDVIGSLSKPELEAPIETIDVKAAQEKLTTLGYDPGPIDGFAGENTRTAVAEYQKDNNLEVDGLLGQQTWASLQQA